MTTLAVTRVTGVNSGSTDPTKIDVTLQYVGIAAGQSVTAQVLVIHDMDPTITNLTWENALKTAVKNILTSTFGYSFGLLDDVRLVGETLL